MARYNINFANHTSLLLNGIWQQFKREEETDFEIMCSGGEVVKVHTWLMRIFIPHFRHSYFCSLDNVEKRYVELVVEFLYKGTLSVGPDDLRDLKHAAESLNLKELRKALGQICNTNNISQKTANETLKTPATATTATLANSAKQKPQSARNLEAEKVKQKPPIISTGDNGNQSTTTVQSNSGVTQAFIKLKDASQLENFLNGNISIQDIPDATLYFPVNPVDEPSPPSNVQLVPDAKDTSQVSKPNVSTSPNKSLLQKPTAVEEVTTILEHVEEQNSAVQRLLAIQEFDHDYGPRSDRLQSLVDETLHSDDLLSLEEKAFCFDEVVAENVTVQSIDSDVEVLTPVEVKKPKSNSIFINSEAVKGAGNRPIDWSKLKRKRKVPAGRFILEMRCIQCEFIGLDHHDFVQHICIEHSNLDNPLDRPRRRCTECEHIAINKKELITHWKLNHKLMAETKFKCELCDFATNRHILLKRHVRNHHSTDRPFACDQCDYRGTSRNNLKIHQEVHQEKTFDCEICDKKFRSKNYLRKHLRVHQAETYTCPICHLPLKLKSYLKKHLENVHHRTPIEIPSSASATKLMPFNTYTVKKIKCPLCDYNVPQKRFLINHLAIKHQVDEQLKRIEPSLSCADCDFKCHVQSQLSIHMLRAHKKYKSHKPLRKPCVCNLCGITVSSQPHLKRHFDVLHNPHAVEHKCSICDFSTKTKHNLKLHLSRKHNATIAG
ncbi:hypothetical protein CHUAL_008524 [Chamberlinius hualienensis]